MIAKIKRFLSHPYGPCEEDGCDNPAERWMNCCVHHWGERMQKAIRDQRDTEFNRQADIVAEGIRRAAERQENGI